ncbi:hypothetical protein [Oenococcus sicerae]|uniref:hypothetical protein n=1 Tax=Oenococcus sicerae TaxID=2203724 RepID=UPI0010B9B1DF|nr:hypothetical protein OAL24_01706 [Oenococcus sicerae]
MSDDLIQQTDIGKRVWAFRNIIESLFEIDQGMISAIYIVAALVMLFLIPETKGRELALITES